MVSSSGRKSYRLIGRIASSSLPLALATAGISARGNEKNEPLFSINGRVNTVIAEAPNKNDNNNDTNNNDRSSGKKKQDQAFGILSKYASRRMVNARDVQDITPNRFLTQKIMDDALEKEDKESKEIMVENMESHALEADFIIVGYGSAGKSARHTLKQFCPGASVVVVDPFVASSSNDNNSSTLPSYLSQSVTKLDSGKRMVYLADGKRAIRYKHSLLITSGSRGAPPPPSIIDTRAASRVLEMRSTSIPSQYFQDEESGSKNNSHSNTQLFPMPTLPPSTVRGISLMAASQNANVCIIGGGLEAVELAVAAAKAASKQSQRKSKNSNNKNNNSNNTSLIFGNAGPLASRLPQYLSSEVSKKLKQCGISVYERTLVRYISPEQQQSSSSPGTSEMPGLDIHLAKQSDSMDTKILKSDLVVVAPSVQGHKGSAILPTFAFTDEALSWSQATENRSISCYSDDGRIAINAEFNAATGVYAAGSVARYPDHKFGQAEVAGEGVHCATVAGEAAAKSMALEYNRTEQLAQPIFATESCAQHLFDLTYSIWRTDQIPSIHPQTLTEQDGNKKSSPVSAMSDLGIHALCVGKCNAETMSTHGFWWTNKASSSRGSIAQLLLEEESNSNEQDNNYADFAEESKGSDDSKRKYDVTLRRQLTRGVLLEKGEGDNNISSSSSNKSKRSVYGMGVVFYFDGSGTLRGIMTWGVPFSSKTSSSDLNDMLLSRMRNLLVTNGEVARGYSTRPYSILSVEDLTEESKWLLSLAYVGGGLSQNIFQSDGSIARPLYRFTNPKHGSSMSRMGILKRNKEVSSGNSDLFARDNTMDATNIQRSPALIQPWNFDPNPLVNSILSSEGNNGGDGNANSASHNLDRVNLMHERRRPPKEEILWVRDGDVRRSTSAKELIHSVFSSNMRQGKFSNGKDAFKPPPVPKFIKNATSKFDNLTKGEKATVTENSEDSN